jgi:endogenous inhibitor of DNA gyrase (YacG/DUF329 family)
MTSKKIKVKCNFCGKEKEFFPYRIKRSNRLYCSRICKQKDNSRLLTEAHKNKKFGFGINSIGGFPKGKKNPKLSEYRKKLVGELNPFYGKKHTKKTKENIRNKKVGQLHSEKTIKLMSSQRQGENHWNWQGGITPLNKLLRLSSKWKIWREAIFLRDNFTCQNPNCEYCKNKMGVKLHPHHIKPIKLFPELIFNIDNGITYCAEFHIKGGLHKEMQKII